MSVVGPQIKCRIAQKVNKIEEHSMIFNVACVEVTMQVKIAHMCLQRCD
jgi:hypothetical protein